MFNMTRAFQITSAVALTFAVALTAATSMLSYLAASSVGVPNCIGQELVEGYRTGIFDFLAFPLFSVIVTAAIARGRKSARTNEFLAISDVTVFEWWSIRLTHGMLFVSAVLFGFVIFIGVMAGYSSVRYRAISSYCHVIAATGWNSEGQEMSGGATIIKIIDQRSWFGEKPYDRPWCGFDVRRLDKPLSSGCALPMHSSPDGSGSCCRYPWTSDRQREPMTCSP